MSGDSHGASNVSALQKIVAVLGGIVAPVIVIHSIITGNAVEEAPAPAVKVEENIAPLAEVEVAPDKTNYVDKSGEEVVKNSCAACHGTGMMNAPKIGDGEGWKARIALGYETLTQNAINGVSTMPPQGGNPDLTELEIARAVAVMANEAGADFTPPEAK